MEGSLFYKADLHIHSFVPDAGAYDVTDATNTPQSIVDAALSKGLKVISITDHNEVINCITAVNYAKDKEILVIPGIEISSIQGHLLLYFENIDQLRRYHGKLSISKDKKLVTTV